MLTTPNISHSNLTSFLHTQYALDVTSLKFLPLGADVHTIVYLVRTTNTAFFLKLRSGNFREISVILPNYFLSQHISHIIQPVHNTSQQLWSQYDNYKAILYPYIQGSDAKLKPLSEQQWVDFGKTLRKIHEIALPENIITQLSQEIFSIKACELLHSYLNSTEKEIANDHLSKKLTTLIKEKHDELIQVIERTQQLAQKLSTQTLKLVPCHADLHAMNILVEDHSNHFYIIDWDEIVLAPKERDLMFIGGGVGGLWNTENNSSFFYKGYGGVTIDMHILAYYRYIRIIQDIVAFCDQVFSKNENEKDREQGYMYLLENFIPNGVLEIAHRTYHQVKLENPQNLQQYLTSS